MVATESKSQLCCILTFFSKTSSWSKFWRIHLNLKTWKTDDGIEYTRAVLFLLSVFVILTNNRLCFVSRILITEICYRRIYNTSGCKDLVSLRIKPQTLAKCFSQTRNISRSEWEVRKRTHVCTAYVGEEKAIGQMGAFDLLLLIDIIQTDVSAHM